MTAVEWLIRVLELESFENINLYSMKAIEQAKEMEKQQLYKFYVQGGIDCITQADRTVEDYYINTFKSE